MTPQEFAERFQRCKGLATEEGSISGVCARFVRGVTEADFEKLSDEPGKRLSWVCSSEMLGALLGLTPAEAMVHIGFNLGWMESRCKDSTQHRLVVFADQEGKPATWENIWTLVRDHFGEACADRLQPFQAAIMALQGYDELEGGREIIRLSHLPVESKYAEPGYITLERFLALKDVTLTHARAFLDHSLGCNPLFTGTGCNVKGQPEVLVPNRPISELEGGVSIPLSITLEDIEKLRCARRPRLRRTCMLL